MGYWLLVTSIWDLSSIDNLALYVLIIGEGTLVIILRHWQIKQIRLK